MDSTAQVTRLLNDYCQGRREAFDQLLPLIYQELHQMAHYQRRAQSSSHTLNTTALVHEAYLKLVKQQEPSWENRTHFFRVAARAMRHILVDYARQQQAARRGGNSPVVALESQKLVLTEVRSEEVLALDEALVRLTAFDERLGRLVELRYFVGLTIPETADAMGLSEATVKRDWSLARAWLSKEMAGGLTLQ